ncbi:RNA polymerase sigma factor [Kineococcus radiotolerans]|uniref:RNA polymerase, sigma-24 subunit, ECF subfamily n=1 Tax=Kineococcus radiotolerans (strain ATCC BAA-149 / DSM 14245 / SRS30216) TaxID=266940 RepID=A6WH06_KINRD|nr:hypothetical protein [Kineococcus radiotolerans]ABS06095.1 hypothetical protein Krad_4636 [Kineococcus radiotolerans SRS30216 = ATCC BAA-149]
MSSTPLLSRSSASRGLLPCSCQQGSRAAYTRSYSARLQVCAALNREWDAILEAGQHNEQVARWSRGPLRHTSAAGVGSVQDLEQACRDAAGSANDTLLLALLRAYQDGEAFAGRVLLQLFLGKIVRMGLPGRTGSTAEEYESDALEAFWTVMSTYPCDRRPRSVAANLALDTLHQVRVRPQTIERLDWDLWSWELHNHEERAKEHDPTSSVLVLIRDGLQAGAISDGEAQLLAMTYAPSSVPITGVEMSMQLGISAATLRQRTSRAVARLSAFVHEDTSAPQRRLSPTCPAKTLVTDLSHWTDECELLELMGATGTASSVHRRRDMGQQASRHVGSHER